MRAIVVGAGVVGLTATVCLREAGVAADVVAREAPEDTTSAVAAALWYPYRALPVQRVTAWSAAMYGHGGAGVTRRTACGRVCPAWGCAVEVAALLGAGGERCAGPL